MYRHDFFIIISHVYTYLKSLNIYYGNQKRNFWNYRWKDNIPL